MTQDMTEINKSEDFIAKASKFAVINTKFTETTARKSRFEYCKSRLSEQTLNEILTFPSILFSAK